MLERHTDLLVKYEYPQLGIRGTHIVQSLNEGVDINHSDSSLGGQIDGGENGESLLFFAVRASKKDLAECLIMRGADVNQRGAYREFTPLMFSTLHDHDDMVNLLLKQKADTELRSDRRETALEIALRQSSTRSLKLLLNAKANINFRSQIDHKTPLQIAVKSGNWESVEALLNCNADSTVKSSNGSSLLDLLPAPADRTSFDRKIAVLLAAKMKEQIEVSSALLGSDFEIEIDEPSAAKAKP